MSVYWHRKIAGTCLYRRKRRTGWALPFRGSFTAAPATNQYAAYTLELLEGATVRATRQVLTGEAFQTIRLPLTAAERDSITAFSGLKLRITANADQIQISQLFVEAIHEQSLVLEAALYQGATLISSYSISPTKGAGAFTEASWRLTAAEKAALTVDAGMLTDLSVVLSATGTEKAQVSQIYIDATTQSNAEVSSVITLKQSGSTIASFTVTGLDSETDAEYRLTAAEKAALTVSGGTVSNLSVDIAATGTGGTRHRISQLYLYADPPPVTPPSGGAGGIQGFWRNTTIPYSPGNYVLLDDNPSNVSSAMNQVWTDLGGNGVYFDGIQLRWDWDVIDTGTNAIVGAVYDWTPIDTALAHVKAKTTELGRPIKLVVDVTVKQFSLTPAPLVPTWLINKYGGENITYTVNAAGGTSQLKSTTPIFWNNGTGAATGMRAAWFALWSAFAARYADDVNHFGWIHTHETASGVADGVAGYTHNLWFDYMKALVRHWRSVGRNFPWLFHINYPAGQLPAFVDVCKAEQCFLGGPDIKIGNPALETSNYDIYRGLNGALPIFHDVQWSNYEWPFPGTSVYQTPQNIIDYCSGVAVRSYTNPLKLQALAWRNRPRQPDGAEAWPTAIIDAVRYAKTRDNNRFPVAI